MLTDIDYFLRDSSRGFARITVGEAPNGSGNTIGSGGTLTDYFYLPGRSGGQIAFGDTGDSGTLTLGSTASQTKGKILFGSSAAFDELNTRMGIGTTSPGAIAELHQTGADQYSPLSSITTFASSWLASDGTSGTSASVPLWNYINESVIDDTTYITRNPLTGVGSSTSIFGGITLTAQASTANIRMRMRMRWSGTSAGSIGVNGIINLFDGNGTLIKTVTQLLAAPAFSGDTGFVNIDYSLSAAEITSIANWTNMRMSAESSGGGAGYSETLMRFSWLGLTVVGATAVNLAAWYDTANVLSGVIDSSGRLGMGTDSDALTARGRFEAGPTALIPLEVMGATGQTADHFRVLSQAGVVLTNITSAGDIAGGVLTTDTLNLISNSFNTSVARVQLTGSQDIIFDVPAGTVDPISIGLGLVSATFTGTSLTMTLVDAGGNNSTVRIDNRGGGTTPIPLQIWRATLAAAANLTEWRDEANAIMSYIRSDGAFIGPGGSAALDLAGYPSFGFDALGQSDAAVITKPSISGVMAVRAASVDLVEQTASIGSTTLISPASGGVFLISTYLACTTAEAGTGNVTVTVGWTDNNGAQSRVVASRSLTSLGFSTDAGSVIRVASGPITYLTTYTPTAGGVTEAYALYLRVTAL